MCGLKFEGGLDTILIIICLHQKLNVSICISDCTANVIVIGDGFCNDETNIADCNYDGGDCCGSCVVTDHCLQCECIGGANETNILIANGFCNDETNTADCNYDGGDCCVNIKTDNCSNCTCYYQENCLLEFTPSVVGDGFCHDETNNADCNFDGGDCCVDINIDYCSECICHHQENCAVGYIPSLIGDGFCNDETNIADCNYDSGDCCVNVNKDLCLNCDCLSGGFITSPGYPEHYDNNLDLYWLIEVSPGQRIEIKFLRFDVDYHVSCP